MKFLSVALVILLLWQALMLPRVTSSHPDVHVIDDREPAAPAKTLSVQEEIRLKGDANVKGVVTFSADGNTLIVCCLRTVHIWDLTGAQPREASVTQASELHVRDILTADISPDGKLLALGGYDKGVHLCSLKNSHLTEINNQMEHDGPVLSLRFSPDGKMLASGGGDMAMILWDIADGQLKQHSMFKVENAMFGVQNIGFAPDGKTVFLDTGTGDVRQVNISTDEPSQQKAWKEPSALSMPMAVAPDGKMLVFGSRNDVKVWAGADAITCHAHTQQVNSLAWAGTSRLFASCGEDGRLIVWDLAGNRRYSVQRPSPFDSVAFRPTNSTTNRLDTWIALRKPKRNDVPDSTSRCQRQWWKLRAN